MVGPTPQRYIALDSWRGIAAILVAAFHIHGDGLLLDSDMARSGMLWVDFFFVLSGFVIAGAYRARIADGFSLARFAVLRLGRVWPLHMVIVAIALVLELGLWLSQGTIHGRAPFSGDKDLVALICSVLLLQTWQSRWLNGWNPPAWSISGELCAYAVAAVLWRYLPRWSAAVFALIIAATVLLWAGPTLFEVHQIWVLVRTFMGFASGVLVWELSQRIAHRQWSTQAMSLLEGVSGASVFLVIAWSDSLPFPLIVLTFALCVLVFARDAGLFSRLLARPLPVLLGKLSFGIYMVHLLVIRRLFDLGAMAQQHVELPLVRIDPVMLSLSGPPLVIDAIGVLLLVAVVGAAWLCWRFVEWPARAWSRKWAGIGMEARHGKQ